MKRLALGILGLAVAGVVVALVLGARSEAKAPSAVAAQPDRSTGSPGSEIEPRPSGERTERGGRPSLPGEPSDTAEAPALAAEPRTYVRDDGIEVRDHRAGAKEPNLNRAIHRPKAARKIDAQLLVSVKNALRPHVTRCTQALPADAFGDDPRLQGEVTISVIDDQVRFDKVNLQTADVQSDALLDCVRAAAADLRVPANGHAAVDKYTITMPFRLRR